MEYLMNGFPNNFSKNLKSIYKKSIQNIILFRKKDQNNPLKKDSFFKNICTLHPITP